MTSSDNPLRIVDTHMHHWDPANTEWFPHLAPDFDLTLIGIEYADRLKVRYLQQDYLAETAAWHLDAYIHVNATSGGPRAFLEEPARLADVGKPLRGLIGTVRLAGSDESPTTQLEIQARTPLFRGVRIVPAPDFDSAEMRSVLSFLEQNHYIYEVFLQPDAMPQAAAAFRRYPELEVVVEHLDWSARATPDRHAEWSSGMRLLADLGPRGHVQDQRYRHDHARAGRSRRPAVGRVRLRDLRKPAMRFRLELSGRSTIRQLRRHDARLPYGHRAVGRRGRGIDFCEERARIYRLD